MATATGISNSDLRIRLEREERTEELAFEQLHSLGKCWICLNDGLPGLVSKGSGRDYQDPVQTVETKLVQRILRRDEVLRPFLLLFRENREGSSLSSLSPSSTPRGEKVAQLLMQSSCSFCRSVFQTLVRLEEELENIREGIKVNLKVLLERRKKNAGFRVVSTTSKAPVSVQKVENKESTERVGNHIRPIIGARYGRRPGPASKRKRVSFMADTKQAELALKPCPLATATKDEVLSESEVVHVLGASEHKFIPEDAVGIGDDEPLHRTDHEDDGTEMNGEAEMEVEVPHVVVDDIVKNEPLSDTESDHEFELGAEIQPEVSESDFESGAGTPAYANTEDCGDLEDAERGMHLDEAYSSDGNEEDDDGDYEPDDDYEIEDDKDPDFLETSRMRSRRSSASGTRRYTSTIRRRNLRLDYPKIEDLNNIVCPECPEDQRIKYSRLSNWKDHYKRNHLNILAQCPHCPRKFSTKFILRRHVARNHTGDEADDQWRQRNDSRLLQFPKIEDLNNIVCPECPEDQRIKYSRLDNWKQHYKRTHLSILVQCPYCPKKLSSKFVLRLHIARHHADKVNDPESQAQNNIAPAVLKTYECPKCAKKLHSKFSWVGHQITQCGIDVDLDSLPFKITLYKCTVPECTVVCYTKKNFLLHQQTHNSEKRFPCPNDCGQSFTREDSVKGHVEFACSKGKKNKRPQKERRRSILKATGVNVHQCPHCSRKFMNKVAFGKHVRSCRSNPDLIVGEVEQPKEKPKGICDICNKSMLLVEIGIHKKRVHFQEKKFMCQYCGKGFFTRWSLKHHVNAMHEKDESFNDCRKPVLCDICGKEFLGSGNLHDHRRRVHFKVVRYSCQICNMSFYHKNDLRKHFRSHKESEGLDIEEFVKASRINDNDNNN